MEGNDIRYLKYLAKQFPTIAETATEIINLQSILSLPKGTEHFSSMIWFSMNPKNKKNIEKQINGAIQGFIDFDWLRATVKEWEDRGDLIPNEACSAPSSDLRLYRLELGRYVDDCDDAGNECYREIRFYEMKL